VTFDHNGKPIKINPAHVPSKNIIVEMETKVVQKHTAVRPPKVDFFSPRFSTKLNMHRQSTLVEN